MRQKHFMIYWPGMAYAGDYYGRNKKEVLAYCRKINGFSRMPKGYAIWEV